MDSVTDICVDWSSSDLQIEQTQFQKMVFVFNAVQKGWTVKKRGDSYIFVKKHEGKKEVMDDSYLTEFIRSNCRLSFG